MTRIAVGLLTVLLVVAGAACGDDSKVGTEKLLNFEDEAARRLGEATPTPEPGPETPVPQNQQADATPVPTAAPQQQQHVQEQVAIEIFVNDDNSPSAFDPPVVEVAAGSLVKWTNTDVKTRSIVSDTDAFESGLLAKGESFVWTAAGPGTFNYHDGTRPYAVGKLEVV